MDFRAGRARIILAGNITERAKYIRAIEEQNKKLRDIAGVQSHVVRAPLTRVIGLAELMKVQPLEEIVNGELLNHLLSSANELDDIIREITMKSEHAETRLNK